MIFFFLPLVFIIFLSAVDWLIESAFDQGYRAGRRDQRRT